MILVILGLLVVLLPLADTMRLTMRLAREKYIPPGLQQRLEEGRLLPRDIDQIFAVDRKDVDYINSFGSTGYIGTIFSLDTALVDLLEVFFYSYNVLGKELNQKPPSVSEIKDVIGSSLKDSISTLGWDIPIKIIPAIQPNYFAIIERILEITPVKVNPGVVELILNMLIEGNQVSVVTSLPRSIALKILKSTQLSEIFQGRVSPENLVTLDDYSYFIENYKSAAPITCEKWQLLRCMSYMRKPSALTIYMDGNRRNLLEAKRMGLSAVALKGLSRDPQALRTGDKVLNMNEIDTLKVLDFYNIVRRALAMQDGPAVQKETAALIPPSRPVRNKIQAPALDGRKKDTFAEEFGSDMT